MKIASKLLACGILVVLAASLASADTLVQFKPPNDVNGQVFTTNSNDGYSTGRGDVFQANSNVTINSVGIYQNLTNITVSWSVAQVLTTAGQVTTGQTVLASGSGTVTTNGLQWIDFGFANLNLTAGNDYHIQFSFNGNSNQNFFYNNQNVPFTQDAFSLIDGTQGGNAINFVMPAIELNETTATPEPGSLFLLGSGLLGAAGAIRRKLIA